MGEMTGETVDPDQAWLDSLAPQLLRDEYPDQMATRSCSCEPAATCGAHRLLARYEALYQHLREMNAERRAFREEAEVVAVGMDVLIQSGTDQAASLVKLRDHLRAAARGQTTRSES